MESLTLESESLTLQLEKTKPVTDIIQILSGINYREHVITESDKILVSLWSLCGEKQTYIGWAHKQLNGACTIGSMCGVMGGEDKRVEVWEENFEHK